jgi:hypothetical protein
MSFVFSFGEYSLLCDSEVWVYWGFGIWVIFSLLYFLYSIFIVNFFVITSASGRSSHWGNHLNLYVFCDCLFSCYLFIFHISRVLGNMINFLTTGFWAFGLSGSDGKRRMKYRNRKVWWHEFRILEDAHWRLSIWEEITFASSGGATWQYGR